MAFGNFLIKQVVEEICRELPKLSTFVTLSPAPNFARWLAREMEAERSNVISETDRATLSLMEGPQWWTDTELFTKLQGPLIHLAGFYYLRAKTPAGLPVDAVARFPSRQRGAAEAPALLIPSSKEYKDFAVPPKSFAITFRTSGRDDKLSSVNPVAFGCGMCAKYLFP